jgi:hypothetical protein
LIRGHPRKSAVKAFAFPDYGQLRAIAAIKSIANKIVTTCFPRSAPDARKTPSK